MEAPILFSMSNILSSFKFDVLIAVTLSRDASRVVKALCTIAIDSIDPKRNVMDTPADDYSRFVEAMREVKLLLNEFVKMGTVL
jgi:hypothetical protein